MSDGEGDAEQGTLRKTRDVSDQPGSGGEAALEGSAGNAGFGKQAERKGRARPRQGASGLHAAGGPGTALSALRTTSPRRLPSEA